MWIEEKEKPDIFAEIENIYVKLVEPSNPYGQVRSAEITVVGPLLHIQPLEEKDATNWSTPKSPEIFDNDGLFALFFCKDRRNKDTRGLVLTRVSAEVYRRVGHIRLTDIDITKLESYRIERVRII
jgi:hypothetical protein